VRSCLRSRWRIATLLGASIAAIGGVGASPAFAGSSSVRPPTDLQARAAYLLETDNNTTVFALNDQLRLPIASTTKLMTAYVTLEDEPLGRIFVEQPYASSAGESLAGLTVGDRYSVAQLLRAMLLPSGGDAANTLALSVGRSVTHFVALMNAAAAQLHLGNTHYATPVGLDTPGNYATAIDLARLAEVLLRNPFFAKVVREPEAVLPSGLVLRNSDNLIGAYPYVVGVKTGHTGDAGYCLVGAASAGGVHLISVVLGDPSIAARDADTLKLLRYGLSLYRSAQVAIRGHTYVEASVAGSPQLQVPVVAAQGETIVIPRATKLTAVLAQMSLTLSGPLPAGSTVDSIEVSENGKPVLSVPLVTADAITVPAASSDVGIVIGGGALLLCAGCSLLVMRTLAMRRARRAVAQ
jgi:D-alanyl-D-alanine carboxypeptidase (penicillin-binding protein 5/6)